MKKETSKSKSKIKFSFTPELGALLALIVISVALIFLNEYFFTASNFTNLVRQVSILAIIAAGQTLVIINGGIDLSVGSVVSFSVVLLAGFMVNNHMPPFLAVILVLVIGAILGLVNGLLINYLHIPAIIATLSTLIAYKGAALVYTSGYAIPLIGKFETPGRGFVGPIPVPTIIMAGVYILCFVILRYTMLGRMIYGLGGNQEAVFLSGRSVTRYRLIVYMLSSTFAAIAAVVLASRLASGQPMAGDGFELDSIAASVLGGTFIFGGAGTIYGTFIGSSILTVINNGLNLMNVSPYAQYIAKGGILAFAVAINSVKGFKKM